MTEIEALVMEAFWEVWGRISGDEEEVRRRLRRRRGKGFLAVPRALCAVVRAGDTRWERWGLMQGGGEWGHRMGLTGEPLRKARLREREEGRVAWREEIWVSGGAIRRLCEPVRMEAPMTVDDLALALGVPKHTVWRAVFRGVLERVDSRGEVGVMPWDREGQERVEREMAGRGGRPEEERGEVERRVGKGGRTRKGRVLVWTGKALDPGAGRLGQEMDPMWGDWWGRVRDGVEEGFGQRVVRVRSGGGRESDRVTKRQRDKVRDGGRGAGGARGLGGGWKWECPRCGRWCRMLYLPVRLWSLPEFLGMEKGRKEEEELVRAGDWLGCGVCHGVRALDSGSGRLGWGAIVAAMSGGLLYGREVGRGGKVTRRRRERVKEGLEPQMNADERG